MRCDFSENFSRVKNNVFLATSKKLEISSIIENSKIFQFYFWNFVKNDNKKCRNGTWDFWFLGSNLTKNRKKNPKNDKAKKIPQKTHWQKIIFLQCVFCGIFLAFSFFGFFFDFSTNLAPKITNLKTHNGVWD